MRGESGWGEEARGETAGDGDAGVVGVPLSLGGSLGCAGRGWRKEEEKRKSSQGEGFFFLSSLPCNYSYIHRSLCKLTCGLREAN